MSEAFQVIFNSQGSNVLNNSNLNAVVYDVNWEAFLPKQFKRFHCQFIFKSQNNVGSNLTDNGLVNMNIGRVNIYDGHQMSTNLGIVYPVILVSGSYSFYCSTNNDNNDFWIDYPVQTQITITLKTFAGVAMGNMKHYVLMLNLIGIEPDEQHGLNYEKHNKHVPQLLSGI